MAKLTVGARKTLPAKAFALPKKKAFPIQDKNHARNALSRASRFGSPKVKSEVRSAVKSKFPSIGQKKTVMKTNRPAPMLGAKSKAF